MNSRQKVLLGAFVLWLFYYMFLGDYFQYREVLNSRSEKAVKEYYRDYPDGWFKEEVALEEVWITQDIAIARRFTVDWPQNESVARVDSLMVALWDKEIEHFDLLVGYKNADGEAVAFFRSLLEFMRDHKQSEIFLSMNGELDLRDFSEFDVGVRTVMDEYYYEVDGRSISAHLFDLKSNYSEGRLRDYEFLVSNALESSFENVLRTNFIDVQVLEKGESLNEAAVGIEISYLIQNQMEEEGSSYPSLWTYTRGADGVLQLEDEFVGYLLGVSVGYDVRLTVPGLEPYTFTQNAQPLTTVTGFDDVSEAYAIMTRQNFSDFASKVGDTFGLPK